MNALANVTWTLWTFMRVAPGGAAPNYPLPMNLAYLKLLIDFNYWARDLVMTAVGALTAEQYERDLGNSFPSVKDTMNHLFHAEWVWHSRWTGVSPTAMPDIPLPDLPTLNARWAEHEAKIRSYVNSLGEDDVARAYAYKLFNGKDGSSRFWEMVAHLVNHGSYHRGQVTTMLRQLGAAPPASTDMVRFFRTRAG